MRHNDGMSTPDALDNVIPDPPLGTPVGLGWPRTADELVDVSRETSPVEGATAVGLGWPTS